MSLKKISKRATGVNFEFTSRKSLEKASKSN